MLDEASFGANVGIAVSTPRLARADAVPRGRHDDNEFGGPSRIVGSPPHPAGLLDPSNLERPSRTALSPSASAISRLASSKSTSGW